MTRDHTGRRLTLERRGQRLLALPRLMNRRKAERRSGWDRRARIAQAYE